MKKGLIVVIVTIILLLSCLSLSADNKSSENNANIAPTNQQTSSVVSLTSEELAEYNKFDFQLIEIMFGVIIALLILLIYSFFLLKYKLNKVLEKELEKRKFIEVQMKDLMEEYEDRMRESSEDIRSSQEKLKRSENRYKQLVQHIQEGMVIVDSEDNFIFANPAALEIFGVTRSQLMGRNFKEYIYEKDHHDLDKQNELRRKGISSRYETIIRRVDGTERLIKISGSPLFEDGVLVGTIAVFIDRTEQKRSENLHAVLYNISNAVNKSSSLDQLYRKIHKDLSLIIDTTNIYIATYDKKTNIIKAPYYVDTMNNAIPAPQQLGEGLTAYVIKTGKSLYLTQDKRDEMIKKKLIPNWKWKSKIWLGVPLTVNEETIGVIAVQSYTNPKTFSRSDLGILEFVSEQIAIAINNKRSEKALKSSEKFSRAIIDNSPIGISARDKFGKLLIANDAWLNVWERSREELIPYHEVRDSLAFDKRDNYLNKYIDDVEKIYTKGGELFIPELRISGKKYKPLGYKWISQYFYAIKDEFGDVDRVIILTTDITERKDFQDKIELSLKEKEILLKEVHHRVKNNMQIISSMLKLQAVYIKDDEALGLFMDSHNRVKSMALVHEKLYQSENFEKVDFYQYVRVLTNNLIRSLSVNPADVSLIIEIDELFLNINKAIPCGLIINELVSNVFKHAFKPNDKGILRIIMEKTNNNYFLKVSDNGKGLPEDIDIENSDSLGLQLVSALNAQLHGKLSISSDNGTTFEIVFPVDSE